MKKTITEKERAKCKKVAEAYAELCEDKGIVLLDAGKYGFVKLSEYDPHDGFQSTELFTDSKELFDNLWKEWLLWQVCSKAQGTELEVLDCEDILPHLPVQEQKALLDMRQYFMERGGLTE